MIRQSPAYSVPSRVSVADALAGSVADQPPLWLQALAAAAQGTAHGQARVPEDLREAYAAATWPGSPELRRIFLASADKVILGLARHLARLTVTEVCDRIGGIHADPATHELTEASASLLESEYLASQKDHMHAIDAGPELSRIRFH